MTTSAALAAVVVGYDATPHGDAALDWGVRYATDHGRPLLVVHAAGHAAVHDTFSSINAKRKGCGSAAEGSPTRRWCVP